MQYEDEQIAQAGAAAAASAAASTTDETMSSIAIFLRFLGWASIATGGWLLFVSPGEGSELYDRPIVNIHRLSIGVASSVSGVVLLCTASLHSAIREARTRLLTRGPQL